MKKTLEWIFSLLAALILIQTLYFKFSAAPESVYIFSRVGMEPWGRIGSGIAELIAGIGLLIPRTRIYGALLAMGVIAGAIYFHLTTLGIVVQDDGGQLFIYAIITFVSATAVALIRRADIPVIGKLLR